MKSSDDQPKSLVNRSAGHHSTGLMQFPQIMSTRRTALKVTVLYAIEKIAQSHLLNSIEHVQERPALNNFIPLLILTAGISL